MNLWNKKYSKFRNLEKKKKNPDHFTYNYKTKVRIPKDFENFQNLIDLLKNLRDSK